LGKDTSSTETAAFKKLSREVTLCSSCEQPESPLKTAACQLRSETSGAHLFSANLSRSWNFSNEMKFSSLPLKSSSSALVQQVELTKSTKNLWDSQLFILHLSPWFEKDSNHQALL